MFARSHPKPPLLAQKTREKCSTQTSVLARVPHVSQVFARRGDFDFVSCLSEPPETPTSRAKGAREMEHPDECLMRGCPMSRRFFARRGDFDFVSCLLGATETPTSRTKDA